MNLRWPFRCLPHWLWQSLLVSAIMFAPVWGQIHKTIHGAKSSVVTEHHIFSEHEEGSAVCQALDHLGSGDVLAVIEFQAQKFAVPSQIAWTLVQSIEFETSSTFLARAPPQSFDV